MSTQFVTETPENLFISQDYAKQTTNRNAKPKGDINSNFTLYIALTPEAQAKNLRYCMGAGKPIPSKGITYYSKFEGKPEPTPEEVFKNFVQIIGSHSAKGSLQYAQIYWNLNKGNRVNAHADKQQLQLPKVQNVRLMHFSQSGKTCQSCTRMFALPTFQTADATTTNINHYMHRILHEGVPQAEAQAIEEYLRHYFLSWEYVRNLEAVEPNDNAPQYQQSGQPQAREEEPKQKAPAKEPQPKSNQQARQEAKQEAPAQEPQPISNQQARQEEPK